MGLQQLNFEGKNKVEAALELLRAWEPPEGYYLAFSGGKDSVVIFNLACIAGVKFDAHYCVSPIDPIEIHNFIKLLYPDVIWDYHARGFWKMVTKKGLPTRRSRWCCEVIKEAGGLGRVTIVGNRREEGRGRSKQKCYGQHTKKDIFFVRPIIDWSSEEVWEYIHTSDLAYCSLYAEGFKRLGCVLCPLANWQNRLLELKRFPKIANLWRRACDRLVERRLAQGKDKFISGEELWDWWISFR